MVEATVNNREGSKQELAVKASMVYSLLFVIQGAEGVSGLPLVLSHPSCKLTLEGNPNKIFVLIR